MARQALAIATAALLAGIAAGDAAPLLSRPALLLAPIGGLIAIFLRRSPVALAAIAAGGFLAGAALPARWTAPPGAKDLARLLCGGAEGCGAPVDAAIEGTLAADPVADAGGTRLLVDVAEIGLDAGPREARGRVLVYLAGEAPGARAGDRLRFRARLREPRRYHNPGCPDRPRALARRGVRRLASVDAPEALAWLAGHDRRSGPLDGARRELRGLLRREGGRSAPVLEALLLGERGGLAPALRESYARAGVAHVLAVSGLHVALVALAAGASLGWLLGRHVRLAAGGGARRIGILGGLAAAWGYALLAGAVEPALRAALMATVLLAGAVALRRGDPWHALWLAAGCLAMGDPVRVFETGVQLSFASVAGLLWCRWKREGRDARRPAADHRRRAGRWIRATVLAALIATLATLPVQATVFGRVSLAAPLANLVVVPLLGGLALPLLLVAAAICPLSAGAAGLVVRAAAQAAGAAGAVAGWFATAPWSTLPLPPFTPLETAAFYAFLAPVPRLLPGGPRGIPRRRGALAVLVAGALALAADAAVHVRRLGPPVSLRVRFLDVGQGDAALVEGPGGERILVDAGPAFALPGGKRFDAGERVVTRTLRAAWIRRLDVLAVTHPDADHAGGARAVLEGFRVGEVWVPAGAEAAEGIAPLVAAARERGVPVRALARGDARRLGGGARIEVLGPPRGPGRSAAGGSTAGGPARPRGGWNDRSLVLRFLAPGLRVLMTGDLEAEGEQALLGAGLDLGAEVLKVGHHGSGTSSRSSFLAAVHPRLAVISAGPWNRFGFPDRRTLARLEEAGAEVRRTDRRGAITVAGGGKGPGGAEFRHCGGTGIFVQWERPIGRKGTRIGASFECIPPAVAVGRGEIAPTKGGP